MRDEQSYSLLAHNTFGIDASCSRFIEYSSTEEAQEVASILQQAAAPYMVIGAGSNLLLTRNFDGIVVHSAILGKNILENPDGTASLRCGSGETWDDIVSWTVGLGFPSLVNLSLIPGEAGASAVQNIGAYGAEACQYISSIQAVEIATGRLVTISGSECSYGYRTSRFKHEWKGKYLVTHVEYALNRHSPLNIEYGNISAELERRGIASPTPQQLRNVIIDIRQSKLPDYHVQGNAGSFFMNPVVEREKYNELAGLYPQMPHYYIDEGHEKIPAGWLIDQCGWKGRSMGQAAVHHRQALVLVNLGGASGQDIVNLCHAVCQDVRRKFGIELTPEVNIL